MVTRTMTAARIRAATPMTRFSARLPFPPGTAPSHDGEHRPDPGPLLSQRYNFREVSMLSRSGKRRDHGMADLLDLLPRGARRASRRTGRTPARAKAAE